MCAQFSLNFPRTAADCQCAIVGDERDRVGLDMLADFDSECERAHLGVGGRPTRHDFACARIFDSKVRRLHQQSAEHLLDVELVAIHSLRIERHHSPIFLLAQKRDDVVRVRRTD